MGGISVLFLMSIFSFILFALIAIIIYEIAVYIFESISIMCMCKNLKYKYPITAWLPFYNKYLLGKISENQILGVISSLSNIVMICTGIYSYTSTEFSAIAFIIFLIFSLLNFIFDIVLAHKIYANTNIKYGDLLTVFSVLTIGILRPIFLFLIRNKVNIQENKK